MGSVAKVRKNQQQKLYIYDAIIGLPSNPIDTDNFRVHLTAHLGLSKHSEDLYNLPPAVLEALSDAPLSPPFGTTRPKLDVTQKSLWQEYSLCFRVICTAQLLESMECREWSYYKAYAAMVCEEEYYRFPEFPSWKKAIERPQDLSLVNWTNWISNLSRAIFVPKDVGAKFLLAAFGDAALRYGVERKTVIEDLETTTLDRLFENPYIEIFKLLAREFLQYQLRDRAKGLLKDIQDVHQHVRRTIDWYGERPGEEGETDIDGDYIELVNQASKYIIDYGFFDQWLDPMQQSPVLSNLRSQLKEWKHRIDAHNHLPGSQDIVEDPFVEHILDLEIRGTNTMVHTLHQGQRPSIDPERDAQDHPAVGVQLVSPFGVDNIRLLTGSHVNWPTIIRRFERGSAKKVAVVIREHQWQGSAELLVRMYNKVDSLGQELHQPVRFAIVGDAPGVGKTIQAILFIDMVARHAIFNWHYEYDGLRDCQTLYALAMLHNRNVLRERLLGLSQTERRNQAALAEMLRLLDEEEPNIANWAGTKEVSPPHRPTIVVTPGRLIPQWLREIRRMTNIQEKDILCVDKGAMDRVVAETLATKMRDHDALIEQRRKDGNGKPLDLLSSPITTIVLVSVETIRGVWHRHFNTANRKRRDIEGSTILNTDFGIGILDEANVGKNANITHKTLDWIAKKCTVFIAMTGSPITTSATELYRLAEMGGVKAAAGACAPKRGDRPPEMQELEVAESRHLKRNREGTFQAHVESWWQCLEGVRRNEQLPAFILPKTHHQSTLAEESAKILSIANSTSNEALDDYKKSLSKSMHLLGHTLIRRQPGTLDTEDKPIVSLGKLFEFVITVQLSPSECADAVEFTKDIIVSHLPVGKRTDQNGNPLQFDQIFAGGIDAFSLDIYGVCYGAALAATNCPGYMRHGRLPLQGSKELLDRSPTKICASLQIVEALEAMEKDKGHKYLVFSQSVEILPMFRLECAKRGFGLRSLVGTGSSKAQRDSFLNDINAPGWHPVDGLEAKAGGPTTTPIAFASIQLLSEGFNIHGPDVIIVLGSYWSEGKHDQLVARCHRQSPDPSTPPKNTYLYYLFASNSADMSMLRAINSRQALGGMIGNDNERDDELAAVPRTRANLATIARNPRNYVKVETDRFQILNHRQRQFLGEDVQSLYDSAHLPQTNLVGAKSALFKTVEVDQVTEFLRHQQLGREAAFEMEEGDAEIEETGETEEESEETKALRRQVELLKAKRQKLKENELALRLGLSAMPHWLAKTDRPDIVNAGTLRDLHRQTNQQWRDEIERCIAETTKADSDGIASIKSSLAIVWTELNQLVTKHSKKGKNKIARMQRAVLADTEIESLRRRLRDLAHEMEIHEQTGVILDPFTIPISDELLFKWYDATESTKKTDSLDEAVACIRTPVEPRKIIDRAVAAIARGRQPPEDVMEYLKPEYVAQLSAKRKPRSRRSGQEVLLDPLVKHPAFSTVRKSLAHTARTAQAAAKAAQEDEREATPTEAIEPDADNAAKGDDVREESMGEENLGAASPAIATQQDADDQMQGDIGSLAPPENAVVSTPVPADPTRQDADDQMLGDFGDIAPICSEVGAGESEEPLRREANPAGDGETVDVGSSTQKLDVPQSSQPGIRPKQPIMRGAGRYRTGPALDDPIYAQFDSDPPYVDFAFHSSVSNRSVEPINAQAAETRLRLPPAPGDNLLDVAPLPNPVQKAPWSLSASPGPGAILPVLPSSSKTATDTNVSRPSTAEAQQGGDVTIDYPSPDHDQGTSGGLNMLTQVDTADGSIPAGQDTGLPMETGETADASQPPPGSPKIVLSPSPSRTASPEVPNDMAGFRPFVVPPTQTVIDGHESEFGDSSSTPTISNSQSRQGTNGRTRSGAPAIAARLPTMKVSAWEEGLRVLEKTARKDRKGGETVASRTRRQHDLKEPPPPLPRTRAAPHQKRARSEDSDSGFDVRVKKNPVQGELLRAAEEVHRRTRRQTAEGSEAGPSTGRRQQPVTAELDMDNDERQKQVRALKEIDAGNKARATAMRKEREDGARRTGKGKGRA